MQIAHQAGLLIHIAVGFILAAVSVTMAACVAGAVAGARAKDWGWVKNDLLLILPFAALGGIALLVGRKFPEGGWQGYSTGAVVLVVALSRPLFALFYKMGRSGPPPLKRLPDTEAVVASSHLFATQALARLGPGGQATQEQRDRCHLFIYGAHIAACHAKGMVPDQCIATLGSLMVRLHPDLAPLQLEFIFRRLLEHQHQPAGEALFNQGREAMNEWIQGGTSRLDGVKAAVDGTGPP